MLSDILVMYFNFMIDKNNVIDISMMFCSNVMTGDK